MLSAHFCTSVEINQQNFVVKNDYSISFCYEINISRSLFSANSNVFSFPQVKLDLKQRNGATQLEVSSLSLSLSISPSLSLCLSTYMYIQTIHDFQIGLRTPSRSEDVRGPRLCHVTSVPPCPLVLLRTYSTPVTRDQLAFFLSLTLSFSLSLHFSSSLSPPLSLSVSFSVIS